MAAVVSQWTRDNWSDSFKDDLPKAESFNGFIKDTECPMNVYVDKETGIVYVSYPILDNKDINEYQKWIDDELSVKRRLESDDIWWEVVNQIQNDFTEGNIEHTSTFNPPINRIQLERELDRCKSRVLKSYNSAFNNLLI